MKMTQILTASSNQEPRFEEIFGLRSYIETFMNHWKLIIGLAFVAAVAAFLAGSRGPDQYSAEANVSLLNVRSEIVFDEQFKTVPQEEGVANRGQSQDDRRDALQALATSKALLTYVFIEVSPKLAPEDRDFEAFSEAGEAKVAGDLLRLKVTWDDAEVAAAIANVWAQRLTTVANQSYVNTSSGTADEATATANQAFKKYQTAQAKLEAFIAANDLDLVQREIGELDILIEELQEQKTNALRLANSTEVLSANRLANTTRDVLLEQMDLSVKREADDRARQLNDWYDRKIHLERLQIRLKDLQAQLEKGNLSAAAASGDSLALMFTRAGLFRQEGMPQLLLNIDLSQLSESGADLTPTDVQALLAIVEDGLTEANQEIERLTGELFQGENLEIPTEIPADHELFGLMAQQVEAILNVGVVLETDSTELESKPLSQTLDRLSDRRQVLRSELEKLEARQRELTRARDTTWDLYTTLDNKAREVEAQFATGAPQARLAVQAQPPLAPDPRGRLLSSLIAAAVGGLIGVVYVFGRAYWEETAPDRETDVPETVPGTPPAPTPGPALQDV